MLVCFRKSKKKNKIKIKKKTIKMTGQSDYFDQKQPQLGTYVSVENILCKRKMRNRYTILENSEKYPVLVQLNLRVSRERTN